MDNHSMNQKLIIEYQYMPLGLKQRMMELIQVSISNMFRHIKQFDHLCTHWLHNMVHEEMVDSELLYTLGNQYKHHWMQPVYHYKQDLVHMNMMVNRCFHSKTDGKMQNERSGSALLGSM